MQGEPGAEKGAKKKKVLLYESPGEREYCRNQFGVKGRIAGFKHDIKTKKCTGRRASSIAVLGKRGGLSILVGGRLGSFGQGRRWHAKNRSPH